MQAAWGKKQPRVTKRTSFYCAKKEREENSADVANERLWGNENIAENRGEQKQLRNVLAIFIFENCRGLPTVHVQVANKIFGAHIAIGCEFFNCFCFNVFSSEIWISFRQKELCEWHYLGIIKNYWNSDILWFFSILIPNLYLLKSIRFVLCSTLLVLLFFDNT